MGFRLRPLRKKIRLEKGPVHYQGELQIYKIGDGVVLNEPLLPNTDLGTAALFYQYYDRYHNDPCKAKAAFVSYVRSKRIPDFIWRAYWVLSCIYCLFSEAEK